MFGLNAMRQDIEVLKREVQELRKIIIEACLFTHIYNGEKYGYIDTTYSLYPPGERKPSIKIIEEKLSALSDYLGVVDKEIPPTKEKIVFVKKEKNEN